MESKWNVHKIASTLGSVCLKHCCLFLSRSWKEHWNLTVQMRNRLQSTLHQHTICTFMTGNTQKPHQHPHQGKDRNWTTVLVCNSLIHNLYSSYGELFRFIDLMTIIMIKNRALLFYPADFALAAMCTNNHQMAHLSSPDYSEQTREFLSLPSGNRHAVLFPN